LLDSAAEAFGLAPSRDAVDYFIDRYYRPLGRPFRFCHPRDLAKQVRHYCEVEQMPMALSRGGFDAAVENYFSML
jgi:hypothetical protein